MEKKLTAQELNEKKWNDMWEEMKSYIQSRVSGCTFDIGTLSLGICKDGVFCQLRGTDKIFKFENNNKMFINAVNKRTGKFVKVYECRIDEKTVHRSKASHIIHNQYNAEEIKIIQDLKDAMVDFYRPNSIKFITDNF